jgi:hypothetical protein
MLESQTQHIMLQVSSLIQVGEQELEVEGERYKYEISCNLGRQKVLH